MHFKCVVVVVIADCSMWWMRARELTNRVDEKRVNDAVQVAV